MFTQYARAVCQERRGLLAGTNGHGLLAGTTSRDAVAEPVGSRTDCIDLYGRYHEPTPSDSAQDEVGQGSKQHF